MKVDAPFSARDEDEVKSHGLLQEGQPLVARGRYVCKKIKADLTTQGAQSALQIAPSCVGLDSQLHDEIEKCGGLAGKEQIVCE
jgi:hypothetical protein